MGTIWLKDFKGGLDTRRMAETLPGGSLILGRDGHVNRGGEFEQRPAFVEAYALPAGLTKGLSNNASGVYVFGSGAAPVMPKGVTYQRLQHPDSVTPLSRILAYDLYQTKIYVIAEFEDGTQYHFYDGAIVTDWQDGRARFAFEVTGGSATPATAPSGSITISGGTAGTELLTLKLGGVDLFSAPVQHTGDNATTAAAIAVAIDNYVSVPEYTAEAVGNVLTITGPLGIGSEGLVPTVTVTGDFAVSGVVALAGGAEAAAAQLTDLTVNDVSVIDGAVDWATSNEATAEAIAAAVNNYSSTPDYTATAIGATVNLLAYDPGVGSNGFAVAFTLGSDMVFTPGSGALAGGLAPGDIFQSGSFAKTVGSKIYVANRQFLNFSGVLRPTGFQTEATEPLNVGAGFIDMSTEFSGSEALQAIAKYLQFIAIFSGRVIQVWYVDPDPDLNKQQQVLNNMGTLSPRSVTQFGDNDLFFLDESGVRSLRARDSSNAASTTDIGIPVDTLIVAKLQSLTALERSQLVGLIEPTSGRFWLVFPDEIFVFSFFEGSKISAWTTYTPAIDNAPFTVDDSMVLRKKVYLRSGDTIYVFGGLGTVPEYDSTEPELWTPFLDADSPAEKKMFKGIDVACQGTWLVKAGHSPKDITAADTIATVDSTTYESDRIPHEVEATHISLRFTGIGPGAKKIAAAAIHFDGKKGDGE